jgi:hypothetical protein
MAVISDFAAHANATAAGWARVQIDRGAGRARAFVSIREAALRRTGPVRLSRERAGRL